MVPRWSFTLFGGLRVDGSGITIHRFRTQKTGALLAYLAYHLGQPHSRELLSGLLWPEDSFDSARHKLSVALSSLRQQLEPPGVPDNSVLVADRLTARLNAEAITTDAAAFERHLWLAKQANTQETRIKHLTQAVNLFSGPLLAGYYEEWIVSEQRKLDAQCIAALEELAGSLTGTGEHAAALDYALRAVALDPLREDLHRRVMTLYARNGQCAAAIRHYHNLERTLDEECGVRPSAETRSVLHAIREQADAGGPLSEAIGQPFTAAASCPALEPISDLDPAGGALPLDSPFYVERPADEELRRGIHRQISIVVIKGARQVGKSSLLARGLQEARDYGRRVAYTDLQVPNEAQFQSASALLQALGAQLAEQLEIEPPAVNVEDEEEGPNVRFRRFMRSAVLRLSEPPLVWGLDEADRLFSVPFGGEIFALFRSWHNERALNPAGPWSQLTLLIACATEAHLFIRDMNQSPFNVGMRLALDDFSLEQVADLNQRYRSPLRGRFELEQCYRLLEGHPYLVQRALQEMASKGLSFGVVEARADRDDGIFGEHLRRMRRLLQQDGELREAVRQLLRGQSCSNDTFYRLRAAGVASGESASRARLRCPLYAQHLERHMDSPDS